MRHGREEWISCLGIEVWCRIRNHPRRYSQTVSSSTSIIHITVLSVFFSISASTHNIDRVRLQLSKKMLRIIFIFSFTPPERVNVAQSSNETAESTFIKSTTNGDTFYQTYRDQHRTASAEWVKWNLLRHTKMCADNRGKCLQMWAKNTLRPHLVFFTVHGPRLYVWMS